MITIPKTSSNASAGIGVFNVTYAEFDQPEVMALLLATQAPILFYDLAKVHSISPAAKECLMQDCLSYFFVGGLVAVSPSPFVDTAFPEANIVIVYSEQGLQVDYWGISSNDSIITSENCKVWGLTTYAFMICIKQSELNANNLVAGSILDLLLG